MGKTLAVQLAALEGKIQAALITGDAKHTAAWCFGHLPALYEQYCQTRESRYGDEITRLVVAVLMRLADGTPACPESQKLAAGITDHLHLLHAEFGLPGLKLKLPAARQSGPRAGKAKLTKTPTAEG